MLAVSHSGMQPSVPRHALESRQTRAPVIGFPLVAVGIRSSMLVDALVHAARKSPRTPAVSDGLRSLTYKQLALLASVLKEVVSRETGCERVGIMLPASAAFPGVLMGILWSSKVAIPLNFLLKPEELSPIVEDAELDLVITVRHFRDLVESLPIRSLFLEDLPLKRMLANAMFRRYPAVPAPDQRDTAGIRSTSGTTAEPTGVQSP